MNAYLTPHVSHLTISFMYFYIKIQLSDETFNLMIVFHEKVRKHLYIYIYIYSYSIDHR